VGTDDSGHLMITASTRASRSLTSWQLRNPFDEALGYEVAMTSFLFAQPFLFW
jgi:hypothetical protein